MQIWKQEQIGGENNVETTVMNTAWKDTSFEGMCFVTDNVLPWHELLAVGSHSDFLRQVSFPSLNFWLGLENSLYKDYLEENKLS